jgi:hypothetical protein
MKTLARKSSPRPIQRAVELDQRPRSLAPVQSAALRAAPAARSRIDALAMAAAVLLSCGAATAMIGCTDVEEARQIHSSDDSVKQTDQPKPITSQPAPSHPIQPAEDPPRPAGAPMPMAPASGSAQPTPPPPHPDPPPVRGKMINPSARD